jgi:bifunctional non-homologous end joining protein LigD
LLASSTPSASPNHNINDGSDWDGIYVGRRKGKDLIYAGKVDHGFDRASATELRKRLTPLIRKTQPYT